MPSPLWCASQISPRVISAIVLACIFLLVIFTQSGSEFKIPTSFRSSEHTPTRWVHYDYNPIVPDAAHSEQVGTVFDLAVIYETGVYRMYGSWRGNGSVSYSTSHDGFVWDQNLGFSLEGSPVNHWEIIVNRPFVLKRATGEYLMWYTGQYEGHPLGGRIGVAKSINGMEFTRVSERNPVMVADLPWERYDAVMTPCVVGLENDVLRMYYSAGEWYEPDAIGVAHSYDGGMTWVKHGNPVLYPDPTSGHDNYKVTSPHVLFHDGWYYLFYCGFRDMDHATVNLVRSKDGLTNWQNSLENPIVAPEQAENSWNCDAVYKPYVLYDEATSRWLLWYNGRCGGLERIGVSSLHGDFGRFGDRAKPELSNMWF